MEKLQLAFTYDCGEIVNLFAFGTTYERGCIYMSDTIMYCFFYFGIVQFEAGLAWRNWSINGYHKEWLPQKR
jgi:hypothetical protein